MVHVTDANSTVANTRATCYLCSARRRVQVDTSCQCSKRSEYGIRLPSGCNWKRIRGHMYADMPLYSPTSLKVKDGKRHAQVSKKGKSPSSFAS